MTKEEALKQTLEAFEALVKHFSDVSAYEDEEHAFTNELIFIPDIKKAIKAIAAAKETLAQPEQPEQEPVDFASLLREAEEIVQSKPTWKRFIDGTPLDNDIAVWMSVFAQDVARRTSPPQRTWVGLTEVDILAASRHWRHAEDFMAGVYWAAGTLKEKNT